MQEENAGKTEDFGGGYYQQVCENEVITYLRPLLAGGGYKLRDVDGKCVVRDPSIGWETPWHHIVHDEFLDCQRWHSIMFDLFSRVMPGKKFVPSSCQQCWKVVVRPQNLLGLFALMEMQLKMKRPSKCGIEVRPYVHGLYGGYFYNHTLEQGLECFSAVRDEVDKTKHLGPNIAVILKRACTEYENTCGPSDEWEVTDKQIHIESLVNKWCIRESTMREQPEHALLYVHKKWIEWAYANNDGTYLNFTNGKPLYKPYVTYQHLVDAESETKDAALLKYKRQSHFDYDL